MKIRQKEIRLKDQFLILANQQLQSTQHNDILITNVMRVQPNFNPQKNCSSREYLYILPLSLIDTSKPFKNTLINTQGTIMYNSLDELLTRFNQLLAKYVGRHAFHNYTERIDAGADESYRYVS
jgi:tRNA pseudouridine(38-40) synthase